MIEYIVFYLYKVQYLTYLWHQYNNEDIRIDVVCLNSFIASRFYGIVFRVLGEQFRVT